MAVLLEFLFSDHKGPPPLEWEAPVNTGVQILVAICASLLAVAEKAILLQAVGVPDSDVAIITEAATSSSEEPGTSNGGITPQGPNIFAGAAASPIFPDHPWLSAPHQSASWLLCGLWPGLNVWSRGRDWFHEQLKEGAQWSSPSTLWLSGHEP